MITSGRFARAGQEPDNQLFFDFGPDEPEKPTAPIEITPTPANYRITENTIGIGGAKTKFNRNIVAIRTLKQIEAENRKAAPLEQEILARYVGWGALPQAFDENNRDWKKEYADLKALLTEEEYLAARGSTLNAHYTSPLIARLLVETLGRMGFKSGNILEPSCGTGNFFGVLPERMSQSRLYGVELDSLTGRIARLLYPNAGIAIDGFENARFPDNFFDIAIGNVPFGQYKVLDREHRYDRENFNIHDFFFAKTLDKVRPGGIVAFITSKWTMDKANPAIRIYMAQRAVLLGAVRLPNNAFKANAGTEVTADILFLQKRDAPVEDVRLEEWIPIKADSNGILVNDYFNLHPEMLLGTMIRNDAYRNETECRPFEGRDLEGLLKTALGRIQGQYIGRKAQTREQAKESIPADTRVRNFSYTLVNGVLYYRENSVMNRPKLPAMEIARAKGMVELRDACRAVIDIQLKSYNDAELRACQERLNDVYDRFVSRYGRVNDPANARAFDADSSYYLLCALENLDENRQFKSKSDMFTKRTIRQHIVPSSVDTPQEALLLSISERARVDLPYMSSLTGRTEDELIRELQTEIFPVPGTDEYQTADEYLSGNVREKLETARQYAEGNPGRFRGNVEALEKAQPVPLNATDIDARLGSTWIEPKFIQDFIYELLQTPYYAQGRIEVRYSPLTSIWNVSGKSIDSGNILANTTYGTPDASAYRIIEDSLNLRAVKIYRTEKDSEGKDRRVLDPDATAVAQQKQEEIKQKFRDWIFAAPYRREALVGEYNRRFNSTRAREYDGSHLTFSGINPNIELRPHQKDAIARILYGGNTLLAHEVGAGKTFVAVAAAMEKKRLGLCHKNLFVVPNHLIEQTAIETIRLYPGANILVAAKRDFEKSNRKKFCARIATGDYDIIIIGHSQFEKIPLSLDRQEWFIQEQIAEILTAIQEIKDERGERWSIKQMEASRKNLEAKLEKLRAAYRKDNVVTFEELGVDLLFVDESHSFKNLYLYTKMHNVAGVSQSEAQKSSDMFYKCRYMDELTGGNGIIFATGTPVSNSMAELFTIQRYLQFDTLKEMRLQNFDSWASTFGETTTALELAPEGTGFRAKTRFARFFNLPELMSVFKEAADIKTADMLDLPKPKAIFQTISVKPTPEQKALIESLSERAALVHDRKVKPHEDNMLRITTDGRKIGLDQRLISPLLPDNPGSKVNACVRNVFRIWDETQNERLTQLIFCDFSTPGKNRFNVYDDIRDKLMNRGVPGEEIAFIHGADTEQKKEALFAKVRSGMIRILMGSTQKMGAGTNVQDRLIASHDLDCPWRPADLEQRAGRIVRQGNRNPEVTIYRYVTESSFDSYLYQTIEAKQRFISQIMTSKTPLRSCEDVDESVLSYAEVKALCIGDPRIKEKMELDIDVSKLKLLEASFRNEHFDLQDKLRRSLPNAISNTEKRIRLLEEDAETAEATMGKDFRITILDETFGLDRDGKARKLDAGKALLAAVRSLGMSDGTIGEYRGFRMSFSFDPLAMKVDLKLTGAAVHDVELGDSATGNLARMDNAIDGISDRLRTAKRRLAELHSQVSAAEEELKREFPRAQELKEKSARLAQLNAELTLQERKPIPTEGENKPDGEAVLRPVAPVAPDFVKSVNF